MEAKKFTRLIHTTLLNLFDANNRIPSQEEVLREYLNSGPVSIDDLRQFCREAGISNQTRFRGLKAAKMTKQITREGAVYIQQLNFLEKAAAAHKKREELRAQALLDEDPDFADDIGDDYDSQRRRPQPRPCSFTLPSKPTLPKMNFRLQEKFDDK
jgi:hypothetical protein